MHSPVLAHRSHVVHPPFFLGSAPLQACGTSASAAPMTVTAVSNTTFSCAHLFFLFVSHCRFSRRALFLAFLQFETKIVSSGQQQMQLLARCFRSCVALLVFCHPHFPRSSTPSLQHCCLPLHAPPQRQTRPLPRPGHHHVLQLCPASEEACPLPGAASSMFLVPANKGVNNWVRQNMAVDTTFLVDLFPCLFLQVDAGALLPPSFLSKLFLSSCPLSSWLVDRFCP
jgi:hypothetical protein